MKKVLITGSRGFIGQHLKKALEKDKIEVVEFNRELSLDVSRPEDFNDLAKVDTVFHLAAVSGYRAANENISLAYLVNVIGTVNVLDYCRRVKAKLIFPSTYVYDKPYEEYKKEADPIKPTTHYSFTKFLGEELCRFYSRVFGVNSLILRTLNVYGPGQDKIYIVPVIAEYLLKEKPLSLTRPEVERSFIYVTDLVEAYIKLAKAQTKPGEVYNVGPSQPTTLKELVGLMAKVLGKKAKVTYSGKNRPHEVDKNRINNSKIKKKINWQPKVNLEKGLRSYFELFQKKRR